MAFDPKKGIALTHGKHYIVKGMMKRKVRVINDVGKVWCYATKNFLCCQEEETEEAEPETEREKLDRLEGAEADRKYDLLHGK